MTSAARRVVMLTQDVQIDRRILLEADALRCDGWHVTIIAMADQSGALPEDSTGVVRAVASPSARKERAVISLYHACKRFMSMNGRVMRPLKSLAWRFLVDQGSFHRHLFLESALKHPCEVVVAHDLPMLAVARETAQAHGARLVYDSHELFTEKQMPDRERRKWVEIERRHIGSCDAVITVNPSIAREIERRYGIPRVHVIYNAEKPLSDDVHPQSLRARCSIPEGAKLLLYQGSKSAGRNLEQLVSAMGLLTDRSIHLVMMGSGAGASALARRARRVGGNVHMTPAVSQSELLAWTASADAGIIPYRANCLNNQLCTPNKLFEFIAAGVPVLASDLPELRAIVDGRKIGAVEPMDTAAQIAAAIDRFFADPIELAARRKVCAAERHNMSWEHDALRLRGIFAPLANP